MIVKRLDHFNIKAAEEMLNQVKTFYMDLLEFHEGFRPDLPGKGAWLYNGDHPIIHLSVAGSAVPDRASNPCLDHVAFQCSGYDDILRKLNRMKIKFSEFFTPELNMTQLFFKDPAGIVIELNFVDSCIDSTNL